MANNSVNLLDSWNSTDEEELLFSLERLDNDYINVIEADPSTDDFWVRNKNISSPI